MRSRFKVSKSPDDAILRTGYDGRGDLIVTGDKHLLELRRFRGARVLTVSEALE